MFLLAVVLVLPAVAVRAQDEDEQTEEAPARKAPAAAAAARNKGYHADDDKPSATQAEDDDAPAEGRPAQGSFTPPAPRQLGRSGSRAKDASGGGGSASGGGVRCEDSIPKLSAVHRKVLPKLECLNGRVFDYWMLPNEAISYQFTAPKSGSGGFMLNEATSYPATNMMATISEVPCDFDLSGGASGQSCRVARVFPNVSFKVGGSGKPSEGCPLKAGKTYFFNIRFLGLAAGVSDSCADLNKQSPGAKDPRCGGIFTAQSNMSEVVNAAACGVIGRRDFVP